MVFKKINKTDNALARLTKKKETNYWYHYQGWKRGYQLLKYSNRPKVALLTLSSMSANWNLTKFLCSAITENKGLSQPISTCLLCTSYLTALQDTSPYRKVTLFYSISKCLCVTSLLLLMLVYTTLTLYNSLGAPRYF